ncbi:MAG: tail fiber protein [Beijerinckiaceae bacterium]|nr:tail fiber protein [Beijerinckiaceae bacterium]
MPDVEPSAGNNYQAGSTIAFNRARWNAVMLSIATRLAAREALEASFEALIADGTQAALDLISVNVAPQLESLTEQINALEEQLEDIIGGGTAPNALQLAGQNPSFYLALANATGTLPVAQVSGVDALIAAAVAGLVNAAPSTLDTLKELADALGGDANFATSVAAALAGKASLTGANAFDTRPTFNGATPWDGSNVEMTGALWFFARSSAPAGWLKANGAAVSVATYAALDSAIYCGNANNAAAAWGYRCTDPLNPSTTRSTTGTHIVLPNPPGEFIRAWDDGRGVDSGRSLWAAQVHAIQDHTHQLTGYAPAGSFAQTGASIALSNVGNLSTSGMMSGNIATETRPRNLAMLACIKY